MFLLLLALFLRVLYFDSPCKSHYCGWFCRIRLIIFSSCLVCAIVVVFLIFLVFVFLSITISVPTDRRVAQSIEICCCYIHIFSSYVMCSLSLSPHSLSLSPLFLSPSLALSQSLLVSLYLVVSLSIHPYVSLTHLITHSLSLSLSFTLSLTLSYSPHIHSPSLSLSLSLPPSPSLSLLPLSLSFCRPSLFMLVFLFFFSHLSYVQIIFSTLSPLVRMFRSCGIEHDHVVLVGS